MLQPLYCGPWSFKHPNYFLDGLFQFQPTIDLHQTTGLPDFILSKRLESPFLNQCCAIQSTEIWICSISGIVTFSKFIKHQTSDIGLIYPYSALLFLQ